MKQGEEKRIIALLNRPVDLFVVTETGSTNDDLKAAAKEGAADYTVLIADRQTGGRGREGRSFFSESGLYMSVLLPWRAASAPYLTHLAAIAVAKALRSAAGVSPSIKWVNDVYVDGKKVCGILSESVSLGEARRVVIGIGVNLSSPDTPFPDELKEIAGSVSCEKTLLAAAILKELFRLFESFSAKTVREEYAALCFLKGKRVTVVKDQKEREATALGLDDALGLVVRYDDGTSETLISGEVRVRLLLR